MHHWKDAHEGHTEHCCLCIPTNIGAHIIGVLLTLSVITNLYYVVSGVSVTSYGIAAVIAGYPTFFYLTMLHHNTEDSRKHYAEAYKVSAQIANFIYIILAIIVLIIGVWGCV